MGYRDPWAEATKNITDSLLAYGQSKLKRDMLIASVAKDDAARAERKESEQLKSDRFAFSQLKPKDRTKYLESDSPRAIRILGSPEAVTSSLEQDNKLLEYESKKSDLTKEYLNPKNPYEIRLQSQTDLLNLSIENDDTNQTQVSRINITNLKTNKSNAQRGEYLTTFAEDGITEGWLLEGDKERIDKSINNQSYSIAETMLSRSFSQNATRITALVNYYNDEMKSIDENFGPKSDDYNEQTLDEQRNRVNAMVRSGLPSKWKYVKEDIPTIFFKMGQGQAPLKVQQKKKKDDESRVVTSVINENAVPKDPKKQVYSIDTKVMFKFDIDKGGREQLVSGRVANELIKANQGLVSTSEESSKKSYIPIKVSRQPEINAPIGVRILNEQLSYSQQNAAQESVPIKTGSDVIDIKTGKKYKVIVKRLDTAKTKVLPGGGFIGLSIRQPYKYVINGKSYTLDEFKNKFGVPIYSDMEFDSTGTRFSTQRLKATEVIPPIK